jgi:uncharacterized protein involved in exopolysaccharide biosynthesis
MDGAGGMQERDERSKPVATTTLVLGAVALVLLVIAFWHGRDLPAAGLLTALRMLWRNPGMIVLSFVIAGPAQVLIAKELITR